MQQYALLQWVIYALSFSLVTASYSNATLSTCDYSSTCTVSGYEGACVSISSNCCAGGSVSSGLCPGSDDIKCCTQAPCSTPSGSGTCMQTSLCSSKGGTSVGGYCSGPSDLQCCVQPPPPASCSYSATCNVAGYEGVCVSVSSGCCSSGVVSTGLCPGADDIKCCTQPKCSTPSGAGVCMQTSLCASNGGTAISGYCNGPSELQCCLGGTPTPPSGIYGVDVSTTISASSAACFASTGMAYVVPRAYMSVGAVDTQACASLTNAYTAGIKTRDVYLFPCPTCAKSAATQMSELVSYLTSNCKTAWSGRVWLDIEGTQYWTTSTSSNQAWFKQLKDACGAYGVRCGIYSSYYQWQGIFGSTSFVYGNELPLWYAHYDNNPSFSDFTPFGGWTSPHAKQYAGTTTVCSMGVDKNYSPAF